MIALHVEESPYAPHLRSAAKSALRSCCPLNAMPASSSRPLGFSRHWEIYRDEARKGTAGATKKGRHAHAYRPHRSEFPPAIPRRVASQQSPLPLRRTWRWNQALPIPSTGQRSAAWSNPQQGYYFTTSEPLITAASVLAHGFRASLGGN